ncbi:hypothetical protein DXA02_14250 [Ruminococcus sp. AM54-1NS]|nr:hypothetical protein DXA02_14250 [Ruminococcus sp. AM54-1NS]
MFVEKHRIEELHELLLFTIFRLKIIILILLVIVLFGCITRIAHLKISNPLRNTLKVQLTILEQSQTVR